jgi:hypothetical protein
LLHANDAIIATLHIGQKLTSLVAPITSFQLASQTDDTALHDGKRVIHLMGHMPDEFTHGTRMSMPGCDETLPGLMPLAPFAHEFMDTRNSSGQQGRTGQLIEDLLHIALEIQRDPGNTLLVSINDRAY